MEQQTQLKYVKTKKLQRVMLQLNLKKQGVCRQVEGVCAIRENHRKGMSGKPQVSISSSQWVLNEVKSLLERQIKEKIVKA